ncbi:MAG TPA: hypothetical protein VMU43_08855 [Candidatus Acidoferrum sp.]|nr:hypothetical protein [Candidatus Acidoferrum sp.]
MNCRKMAVVLLTGGLLCAGPAGAEHTHNWRQSEYSDFDRGTARGVALRSDGKLTPAPKFDSYSDPNLAYVWTLATDSKGRLYAAGGSDAQVLRLDDPAKPTKIFESAELAAQALAFDSKDNLYVGTSPDGKVYKVTPDGKKSVFFEPKAKYIWAIAVSPQGDVFVGTGDEGKIFVVGPDGKGKLFYQSDERHARSLAFDAKGNLLVGTDPSGLVLRIEVKKANAQAAPDAGPSFVIYETSKKEVTSLLTDASGNIYAASVGEKQRTVGVSSIMAAQILSAQAAAAAAATSAREGAQGTVVATQGATPPVFPFFPSTSGGSEVVKISPDGSPDTLWTSREDLVFAMGFTADGKLLLGTGNKGTIIQLEGDSVYSTVAKTASSQVMSLARGSDGRIFVATANPGKIFSLGPGYDVKGSFESDTFDARIFSQWGRLTWWGENGAMQSKVEFYVRSGNTSSPEKNWSAWAGPYSGAGGDKVNCPPARFVQWKAVFLDNDHSGLPSVTWVNLAYLPKNVAPVVDDIAIQDPNVRVQSFAGQAGPGAPQPAQLRMPQRQGVQATFAAAFGLQPTTETGGRPGKVEVPPQGFSEHGYESVLWSAHDDNDDDLIYSVYYRAEGDNNWLLLKDKVTQKFYSWDTTTMPDGAYYLKIVASDEPSNPPDQKLTGERASDRFVIANTPPKIVDLKADASGSTAKVTFTATSTAGAVARAMYSVDAGDWRVLFPVGELSDAPKEDYQFSISGLKAGNHIVSVQVGDAYDNTTAAKTTFTVAETASK